MNEPRLHAGTEATAAAEGVAAWAAQRFDTDVGVRGLPTTSSRGLDNYVHFVEVVGDGLPVEWTTQLVVRVQQTPDRFEHARREAEIQDWVATMGFPAPPVLALFEPGEVFATSAQVMPCVSGSALIDQIVPQVWKVPHTLGRLARLHADLHRLPVDGFPEVATSPSSGSLCGRRLDPVRRWAESLRSDDLRLALARVDRLGPALQTDQPSLCHGDFHPLNIVGDDVLWVIDWTDAELGDRHGDVARTQLLFRVAAIAATSTGERLALKASNRWLASTYLRAYERELPIDRRQMARWETVHLLHGWGQVLALHEGIIGRDRDRSQVPPALAEWLRRRLDRRLRELD